MIKIADAWDGYATMMVTGVCIQSLHHGEIVPVQLREKPGLYL